MASDSDDDSLLAMGNTFSTKRKSTRDKSRKSAMEMALLDDALENDSKRRKLQDRMERMKQEEPEEDYLVKAETIALNAASNSKGAKRRREINDEIDGIAGDDEDGMDQKRRAFFANAADTDGASLLGVRQIFKASEIETSSLYNSEEDAIRELKKVLKQLEREHCISTKNAVTKPLRAALRENMLVDFLSNASLSESCRKFDLMVFPEDLCRWLFEVASSGGRDKMSHELSLAAFDSLMGVYESKLSSQPLTPICEIVPRLEEWYGLEWTASLEETRNDAEASPQSKHPNAMGLRHFLTLSAKSLELEQLDQPQPILVTDEVNSDSPPSNGSLLDEFDITIRCVVALQRAGLDVSFSSGRRLLKAVRYLLNSLLTSVSLKLSHDKWMKWMDSASNRTVDQCLELGPGAPGTEDADDENAWLCLPLVVRNFRNLSPKVSNVKVDEFKARLAIRALQACLGLEDWETHLKSILLQTGNADLEKRSTETMRWKAFASAYVGLISIERQEDTIVMDGPRCLSTIEIALHCANAGQYLFSACDLSSQASDGIYGSKEEASAMCHVLGLLENQCNQLMKRVKPMSSRPHYRRTAYLLSCRRVFHRHVQTNASKMAGHSGAPNIVQQSMDSWLSGGNDSDDESEQLMSQ